MDDATPEESKPKGIRPAKLTAIIVAAVVVALAGIGGGYAYWTHHEGNAYHESPRPKRRMPRSRRRSARRRTRLRSTRPISSRSRSCWTGSTSR